jgi:carboxymethylenebutenolidase
MGDKNNVGSVIYYEMPVRDVNELKKLNSDVLGLFTTEERISKAVIEEFADTMKTGGKPLDYKFLRVYTALLTPATPSMTPPLPKKPTVWRLNI